jgi:hypothetical protein
MDLPSGAGNRVNPIEPAIPLLSKRTIVFRALLAGVGVLALAISLQWYIYFNWMHEPGTVEIAGSLIAGALMFVLVFRTLNSARQRKIEIIERLKAIGWMVDRIRNSLQAIECLTYAAAPSAADDVRDSVDVIEVILGDLLSERNPERTVAKPKSDRSRRLVDQSANHPHADDGGKYDNSATA